MNPPYFTIYAGRRSQLGRWREYAEDEDGIEHEAALDTWFTKSAAHALYARSCGMLVADVDTVPFP